MDTVFLWLDGYAIQLYRMTGSPLMDYFIGTFLLAVTASVAGEASVKLLRRVNGSHMERLDGELARKHELSVLSKHAGDEQEYRRLNREANDAFGRVFFNMFTLSAASLWAVFIVLAWMQSRFMKVEFPLPVSIPVLGESVGYVSTFLFLYVGARILIRTVKRLAVKN